MLHVIIVGGGIAGLVCALACRQNGLDVTVMERSTEFGEVGAGIQVPPNAARMLQHLGLLEKLKEKATVVSCKQLRRYEDGEILISRDLVHADSEYGAPFLVAHRADYHRVLEDALQSSGVKIKLGAQVRSLDFDQTQVILDSGEVVNGDIIVGADGLWSRTRDLILGDPSPPSETGDLAYRATFKVEQLMELNSPSVLELIEQKAAANWIGPDKHCIVYPIRGGKEYNMVLLRPDNLPIKTSKVEGDLEEMRETFRGWDPVLTTLISRIPSVLKWKLCHHKELETWCKKNVVVIGDACHPTLPYQAQGAAIATEDGTVLGNLLGKLSKDFSEHEARARVPSVLRLFESLRKQRTTLNVQGAVEFRHMFHMHDGVEQMQRDEILKAADLKKPCIYGWADPHYQMNLFGFDVLSDSDKAYARWKKADTSGQVSYEDGSKIDDAC